MFCKINTSLHRSNVNSIICKGLNIQSFLFREKIILHYKKTKERLWAQISQFGHFYPNNTDQAVIFRNKSTRMVKKRTIHWCELTSSHIYSRQEAFLQTLWCCRTEQEDRLVTNSFVTRTRGVHLRKKPSPCQSDTLTNVSMRSERTRIRLSTGLLLPLHQWCWEAAQRGHTVKAADAIITNNYNILTKYYMSDPHLPCCTNMQSNPHQSQQITSAPY